MVPRAVALLKRRIFGWGSCYISFPLPILQMLPVIGRPAPELTAFVPGLLGCGLHTKLTNSYRRGDGAAWWLYGATHLPTTRPFSPKRIFLLDSRSEDGQEQQQDFPSSVSNTWSLAGESGAGTTMNSTVGVNGGAIPATLPPVVGDIRRSTVDTLCVRPRSDESDAQAERGVPKGNFVELFRGSAPYIRAHRGAVMVVHMGGEVLEGPGFMSLMDDMGLLTLLGVRTPPCNSASIAELNERSARVVSGAVIGLWGCPQCRLRPPQCPFVTCSSLRFFRFHAKVGEWKIEEVWEVWRKFLLIDVLYIELLTFSTSSHIQNTLLFSKSSRHEPR